MQEEPVDHCYTQPHLYRLCNKVLCIPWKQKCPCRAGSEFRCLEGNCIPIRLQCDGIQQCLYGEDEKRCDMEQQSEQTIISTIVVTDTSTVGQTTSSEGKLTSPGRQTTTDKNLPMPVVVTITSVSVFVCIIVIIFLCLFITRKKTNIKDREQKLASKLSQENSINGDFDDSDSDMFTKDIATESMNIQLKGESAQYLQEQNPSDHYDFKIKNYWSKDDDGKFEIEDNCSDSTDDVSSKERKNLAINPGAEIYNTDQENEYRFIGLGRFTFKPRLKYFDNIIGHERDERTRETLGDMKNCQHHSKMNSVPGHVIVYKDISTF